jgi:predicted RNA binding protein YcfA (HicA-like mRNA interferase family)
MDMKNSELIKRLQNEGWELVRQKGSHKVFKRKGEPKAIVLAYHGANKEQSIGVLNTIKKTAGWE